MIWLRQRDQFNWICWIIQRFLISWRTNTERTADRKADNVEGNTVVIAAVNNETCGNDHFTSSGLDVFQPPPGPREHRWQCHQHRPRQRQQRPRSFRRRLLLRRQRLIATIDPAASSASQGWSEPADHPFDRRRRSAAA